MVENSLNRLLRVTLNITHRLSRWWLVLPVMIGILLFLIWTWATGWFIPIISDDISQIRANTTLPALQETSQVRQTFIPRHDGLTEVEVMIVRPPEGESAGRLAMQLLDSNGQTVGARSFESRDLFHNQTVNLHFPPQAGSAGQPYTLLIAGTAGNDASVWGYDLDVYKEGELTMVGEETAAQELRLTTRYQLSFAAAIEALAGTVWANGGLMLLALVFMFLPGCLLLVGGSRWLPRLDPAAWLGLALALGVASWPVIWLWLTVFGGRWRAWSLWFVLILGWAFVVWKLVGRGEKKTHDGQAAGGAMALRSRVRHQVSRITWHHLLLLLILLLGLAVRLLAVRDLAFPPWVDSSRHALITAVMAESGQTIQDYSPYLEVDRFLYHFGFHTLSASLAQMIDVPLPGLLLILGQLINALVPLTVYAAVYLLVRRSGAALLAAFLVALPFFFPGYYATWGRMTQLTALLVMAAALAVTWQLIRGARIWRRAWWFVALLVAGLFLIHFRLFLLYLVLAGLTWLISRGRHGKWLALAAGVTALLVAPHMVRLVTETRGVTLTRTIAGYNDFPLGYVTIGWERAFLILAAASLILAALAGLRGRAWAWLPLTLAAWAGLVTLLLSGQKLGLPETSLVNLNSAYISAFLPLVIILAITAGRIWRWLRYRPRPLQAGAAIIAGVALAAALLFGIRQQITIINPVTILAWTQDVDGLNWLEEHVGDPAAGPAKVAVSSWLWLGQTWTGSDGGAWIVPLTGIASTTPPADYIYNRSLVRDVNEFNKQASATLDWSDPSAADWLQDQGVTHLYVGAKGGYFDPASLARNPKLQMLYGADGVFVFTTE